jgi:hypothetical protein
MSGIESTIGKMPMSVKPVRQLVVDDPTQPSIQQSQETSLPSIEKWQKISPREYNQMRRQINEQAGIEIPEGQSPLTFSATEPVFDQDSEHKIIKEDADMLNMFINPNEESELAKKIATQAKSKQTLKSNMKQDKKNKIEILLGLRKKTATKEIDGHIITLRNLRSNQTKKILEEIAIQNTGFGRIYTMKHMVVALALDSIDDEAVVNVLGEDDSDELRIEMVSNMDPSIVDELYDMYVKEIGNKISVNSDVEEKEIVEDTKK